MRAAILALLREGPRNGYQIMSEIEERSGGAWRPSPGAVYPALQQLADEGLIEAEESGGRRTFSLTDEGRRYIEENPDMARAAWESMAQHEPGEMPGLFVQAARLGGSIVQMAHAGTPEQVHTAEQLLEQTRRKLYQILAEDAPASRTKTTGRRVEGGRAWTITSGFPTPTGNASPPGCVRTSRKAGSPPMSWTSGSRPR